MGMHYGVITHVVCVQLLVLFIHVHAPLDKTQRHPIDIMNVPA